MRCVMVNRVLVHCCARNLQLVCKWVRMKDRRALSLIADVELTFRSPLYAFFAPLSYRIRLSLEHPKPVTALDFCHLKHDNRIIIYTD